MGTSRFNSCKECKRRHESGCSQWLVKCGSTIKNFILGLFQHGTYFIPVDGEKEGEYLIVVPKGGLDHKGKKAHSTTTLNDIETAAGALLFTNTAAQASDHKMLSKSSDSLAQAAVQLQPRISRYPMASVVASSASVIDRDADSAFEEGIASTRQAQAVRATPPNEMELELQRLKNQLNMVRKEKEAMLNKLDQLHNDNMRLQEESQMTAEQLRHFTDWFFNAIEK